MAERVVEGLQGFLLQIDEAEIVAHEADEPNAIVDLFDAQSCESAWGPDADRRDKALN